MDDLMKFWDIVTSVWSNGILGVDVGRVLVAITILILFILFRQLFTKLILRAIKSWTKRSKPSWDEHLISAVEGPVRLLPIVMGIFFAGQYAGLENTIAVLVEDLVRSLLAFTIFWSFYNIVDLLLSQLKKLEKVFTPTMVEWLAKATRVLVVIIGAAAILEMWGIQIGPLVAGLGLFGVAVALGAQDLFKNLISGVLVIAERRFSNGDWVKVDGVVEGTVESIGFRSTVIRRFDKSPVYVPNAKFSDNAVTNFSEMTHRRIYWVIGVEYKSTVEQLRQMRDEIEAYVLGNDDFAHPPEVSTFVRIDKFSDSSIDLMLYCFTKTTDWGEWLEIKETLACEIKDIVEGVGSSFAFPSQSVYIESLPGEAPESFIPPAKKQK